MNSLQKLYYTAKENNKSLTHSRATGIDSDDRAEAWTDPSLLNIHDTRLIST